ncbi:MAG: cobalamin B12-binding domain-containing protein [Actinobacteria bacterium]|nr:cobalamin B12-binding domain-containing protein [Actinomycetota bacterium]
MTTGRILVAKPGLDGHDRGARLVALVLRDAGFEVIYTGIRQTPATIANAAVQEDVDVVGLSILSGAHLSLSKKVLDALKEVGAGDIPVVIGGLIHPPDVPVLREMGIAAVFPSGTRLDEVVQGISEVCTKRRR